MSRVDHEWPDQVRKKTAKATPKLRCKIIRCSGLRNLRSVGTIQPYVQLFVGAVDADPVTKGAAAPSRRRAERTEVSVNGGSDPDWSLAQETFELQMGAADTHLHLAVLDEPLSSGRRDGHSAVIGERKICLSSISPAGTKAAAAATDEQPEQHATACNLLEELHFSGVDAKALWLFNSTDGAMVGTIFGSWALFCDFCRIRE